MSNPTPALTGTLEVTPLVNLLVYALDQRLTGTVVLEQPNGRKHAMYLDDGAPAKVRLADDAPWLGQVLVGLGKLSARQSEESFEQATAAACLHGSILLEQGLVDDDTLKDAVREQLGQKLERLATLGGDTVWGYYDRINYLERYGAPELVRGKPLALIWRLVQRQADPGRVSDVLQRIGERVLRLHHDAPILRFHFSRLEQAVIEVLRAKPQPYAELLGRDLVEPTRLGELVYMLAITRQLELGSPDMLPLGSSEPPSSSKLSAPPETPPAAPPVHGTEIFRRHSPAAGVARATAPSPPVAPEHEALVQQINDKLALDDDYYALLEVPRDATAAEIHDNYLRLAKQWHPDRLAAEQSELREPVTRIFTRMTEAQQTLCDTLKRREYDQRGRRAAREAEEAEHVQRVLRAASAFQRAEILLKRNSLVQAEEEARKALADDPNQPEYRALVAWLDAQKANADVNASIGVLDKVVAVMPNDVTVRWYRGQLYKRVGRNTRAVRDFRAIVEIDARHVDAQREIRLYEMRHSGRQPSERPSDSPRSSRLPDKSKSGESSGGLLSRLFKR